MRIACVVAALCAYPAMLAVAAAAAAADEEPAWLKTGIFKWTSSPPLVAPARRAVDPPHSIKDPTVVFFGGKYHLFCTIRSKVRTHQIEYLSFADWPAADEAERHVLTVSDGYFCAPQVFFFTPHNRWYLIYQATDATKTPPYFGPAFSTTDDISRPDSWTKPAWLYPEKPKNLKGWIDFWVICDEAHAYLFFTSLDGRMWRARTRLADFPKGFDEPVLCLQADIFEASHTYKLKGLDKYLTLVEAQDSGRRYYKAYLADRLDGAWKPLADTRERPFASRANVQQAPPAWTDSISHGELIRTGHDQRLEVDPAKLRFLYQGVSDRDKAGKGYGDIPWKPGMLEMAE